MAEVNLSALFTAIGNAVNEAQQAIGRDAIDRHWQEYYRNCKATEEGADGMEGIVPRTKRIFLPSSSSEEKVVNVPILTMVHHGVMTLDQVKVRLNVRAVVDETTGGLKVAAVPFRQETKEFMGEKETESGVAENVVELVFQREAPPEGVARIVQENNKFI